MRRFRRSWTLAAVLIAAALAAGGAAFYFFSGDSPAPPVQTTSPAAQTPRPAAQAPAPAGQAPSPQRLHLEEGYRYIGLVLPQTGPLAPMGRSMIRGADMAVEAANANLAAGKKPFRLVLEDEAADLAPHKRLANDPRIPIIVGHLTEASLAETEALYRKSNRPVLLPILSDPNISNLSGGRYFRLMPSNTEQAGALAEFAKTDLKVKNALVIYEDSEYGRALAEAFRSTAQNGGVEVETAPYPKAPDALIQLADKAAGRRPEVVFLAVHAMPALYVVKALDQAGFKATVLGTHALALSDLVPVFHRLTDKTYFSLPLTLGEVGEAGRGFLKKFEAAFHRPPDWVSIMTYDAVRLAVMALKEAGNDPAAAAECLDGFNSPEAAFAGVMGDFYFEVGGRGVSPIYIVMASPSLMGRAP